MDGCFFRMEGSKAKLSAWVDGQRWASMLATVIGTTCRGRHHAVLEGTTTTENERGGHRGQYGREEQSRQDRSALAWLGVEEEDVWCC